MKKVAILLDGGFVLKRLYTLLGRTHATAADVIEFSRRCVDDSEELFRVYYYDCPPSDKKMSNPLQPETTIDFASSRTAHRIRRLQSELAESDLVAFRKGHLSFDGLGLSPNSTRRLLKDADSPNPVQACDLKPGFRQKQVDMKIGLDVAWLASKNLVDRILLVGGDADFVPAMKFARREGTQVVLVPMGSGYIPRALKEHADFVREVPFP
ncbi:MAG: NYN domain-containing protein [Phycisphaerae bacterium]